MLQGFRNLFKSKVGLVVTTGFIGLMGVAFAGSDIANTFSGGTVSGGDRVALVGDTSVTALELSAAASNAIDQLRQSNPTITMDVFLADNGMNQVLDQVLSRTAFAEFGQKYGLRTSDRLIDSEIMQIPAFRGATGKFDQNIYQQVISQRGFSDASVRQDLAYGIYSRLAIAPASLAPTMPMGIARNYASLLKERREGQIAVLPSLVYAPKEGPTKEQLATFYRDNRNSFIRPERRVLRYAMFDQNALASAATPTEQQITARYERDKAAYAASESRRFTQLVVPTQDAANAIAAKVRAGTSLEQAAREAGLATAAIGPISQADFARQSSAAIAKNAFETAANGLVTPARASLGWFVLRVDAIDVQPARSLAQVRAEITAAVAEENLRRVISERTSEIENEMQNGSSLADIAKELNLTLTTTPVITADGRIYGSDGTVSPEVAPLVETAFQMEEGDAQIAELVAGARFAIFDVTTITPSAPAPLAEIEKDVTELWRREQGAANARKAADRVNARMKSGSTLQQAMAAEKLDLPNVENVNVTREQIAQAGQIPAVMALFFSMAEGTTKQLAAPQDNGWFVVQLSKVDAPTVDANDPLVVATMRQLAAVTAEEYIAQFATAIRKDVGVETNDKAVQAVIAQLTGGAN